MDGIKLHRRAAISLGGLWALGGCSAQLQTISNFTGWFEDEGFAIYPSKPEDTMIGLARDLGLGFVEFSAANPGVDPWVMPEGTALRIPRFHLLPEYGQHELLVNLGDMRLYYFTADGTMLDFPVGIGRDGHLTPIGDTTIVRKKANPTWYPPPSVLKERPELEKVVPPGPDNPLGAFALYLDWPMYLIHGTNAPASIGRRQSNGCIRLYPEDIEFLFAQADTGFSVRVIDQPIKAAWREDKFFIQAHPEQSQATEIEETGSFTANFTPEDVQFIEKRAGGAVGDIDWMLVEQALIERRSYPIRLI